MAQVSDVIEALKYTYGADRVEMILNKRSITWNIFKKEMERGGGRGQHITPIYHQLPEGISGTVEGGAKPTALQPNTAEATFSLQEYTGNYDVTWKLMSDAGNGNRLAFEKAVTLLDRGIRTGFAQDISNDMLDDGRGRLAILPAADNTSPVTVSRPIRARQGMVVDIMDTDNDTKHLDSGTISAVDHNANTITVSGTITGTAANDYMVRQDTADDSVNDALHVNGLLGIVDNENPAAIVGNYGGINRSTAGNEWWESTVLDNSGTNRELTEDLILQAIFDSRLKGGGQPNMILTSPGVYRRYYQLFAAEQMQMRSGSGVRGSLGPADVAKDSETGQTPLNFSGLDVRFDDFHAANTMLILDTDDFSIVHGENRVPQPVSNIFDGAADLVDTSNTTFEVPWWWCGELVCQNPAAQAKIEDISES